MIPIYLNLLSDFKKTKLEQMVKFLFIKNLLEITLVTFSVLAIILLWSWMALTQQFNELLSSALSVNQERFYYNHDIKQINILSKGLLDASAGYLNTSPYLIELINYVPANIKINSIVIDRASNSFVISGTAADRQALLDYQNILNGLSFIQDCQIPFSQLLQKTNINFELRAQLKNWPALRKTSTPPKVKTIKTSDE